MILSPIQVSYVHSFIYTFHTTYKKRKYIILHSYYNMIKIHTPTHFYFSLGKQKFLRGQAEKKSWAGSKKRTCHKTHIHTEKKNILQGKKIAITKQKSTHKLDFERYHQERKNIP